MAFVTQARAREIVRRHTRTDGGGFTRISADIQDLLETVATLTRALGETLDEWWQGAPKQAEDQPVYHESRALLHELEDAVPPRIYRPVAVCPACGWEHCFRRVVGVGEALMVSALMEEAEALHGRVCRALRIELRPEDADAASRA